MERKTGGYGYLDSAVYADQKYIYIIGLEMHLLVTYIIINTMYSFALFSLMGIKNIRFKYPINHIFQHIFDRMKLNGLNIFVFHSETKKSIAVAIDGYGGFFSSFSFSTNLILYGFGQRSLQ